MKKTRTFSRAAAAVFAVILTVSLPAADIRNHSTWQDTQGNIIDCHEGGILRMGGTFYWHGRVYKGNIDGIYGAGGARFRCGLNCYSSTNLTSWTFRGAILTYPAAGFLTAGTWHRPRVLYNAQTGKYVLALNEQWLIGPDGKRVPAELSCQLWLPVTFDPEAGIAQMQHVKQWDPWKPATTTRRTDQ